MTEEHDRGSRLTKEYLQDAQLINILPVGIIIGDLEENIIIVNKTMAEMLQTTEKELIQRNLLDFVHEVDKPKVQSEMKKRGKGVTSSYDITMVRADGQSRIFNIVAGPLRNNKGLIDRTIGSFLDVTDEREKENRLEIAVKRSMDAVIMMDTKGKVLLWNPAAEQMFGYSEEEALGMDIHRTLTPVRYYDLHKKGHKQFLLTGSGPAIGKIVVLAGIRKNGEEFPLNLAINAIRLGDGWGALASIRDISENVKLEEDKLDQQRELEIYSSLLRHDLKNDLGVILGNIDLARLIIGEGGNKELFEIIDSIEAISDRMTNLISVFSHPIGSGGSNIVEQLNSVVAQARKAYPKLTVNLYTEDDAEKLAVPGSRLLVMVWENLIRNTVVHAGESSIVEIHISKKDDTIQVVVSDNGEGISEEVIANLFQKGVSTKGGGLGLYLSKKIIQSIGGSISVVTSNSYQGAVFKIVLPIIQR